MVDKSYYDMRAYITCLGGLVGSRRPDLAATIRQHFDSFTNFIHRHLRHLAADQLAQQHEGDARGDGGGWGEAYHHAQYFSDSDSDYLYAQQHERDARGDEGGWGEAYHHHAQHSSDSDSYSD
jgi:hypothetical protein